MAATCTDGCTTRFLLNVPVPVGSTATVTLPSPDSGTAPTAGDMVTEGSAVVFRNGVFTPATEGVLAARAVDSSVELVTGGGSYAFALLQCSEHFV